MPVGRVFDAAQNQVLFSPVTNYYQGKAIRAGLKEQETDIALKEKTLEQADEKLDLEERRVEIYEEQNKRLREQFEAEVGKDKAKEFAVQGYSITYAIDTAVQKGELDEEAALAQAAEGFAEYAQSLPEKYAAPILEKLQDGLDINEYRQIKASLAGALGNYGLLNEGTKKNPFAQINPKDFTPQSVAEFQRTNDFSTLRIKPTDEKPIDFEPPNKAEREHADNLIDKSEKLSALNGNDEYIARDILASDIRQLQAANYSLEAASFMAVAKLEKKLIEVPDWLSSHQELDLGPPGMADNEFLVDGVIFIREDDGSVRARD